MKRNILITVALLIAVPAASSAQDEDVLIPSELELNDQQKKELQAMLDKKLHAVVKSCVGTYPRPEFFATLAVQFELRKSGDLRGGYIPSGVVDSNMYVKSDEEKAKLEEAGSFARLIVRNDRDVGRCLKKGTREFATDFDRYAASISATYNVKWKGKTPSLEMTEFKVTKSG